MPWRDAPPRVTAILVCAIVLTGCAATPSPPEPAPTPAPTPALTVELHQLRSDVAPRQAQVRISNASDTAVTVGDVHVEDPRFDGTAQRVIAGRASTIPAGGSADIRVQLPEVECSVPDDGEAEAVIEIVSDSGRTEATASAPDPLGFVAALHARECLLERVTDAAALAFTGFTPSPSGEPAALELTVTPTGKAEATLVGVERTNLLDFDGLSADQDLYRLDLHVTADDADPVVVQLPLTPTRCDPHAVQEDKRGTIFPLRIEVDGEPGEVELFVGEEMRGKILTWVGAWCGFGG
ncbi:hypothetical protein ACEYYH_19645 [Microbacterium trichothecenolyticum]|uniref:hypothetical protein n=1 Tax=Microbacterium trichothecenolyticum TaxID=69370 RepID=UPI0035BE91AE